MISSTMVNDENYGLQSIMVGVAGFWGGVFSTGGIYLLMVNILSSLINATNCLLLVRHHKDQRVQNKGGICFDKLLVQPGVKSIPSIR